MKPTHVIIPLDVYEQLEKQYDDMPKESKSEAVMMNKAIITGKMQMLYDPSFIRLSLDEKSIELLKTESLKSFLHLRLTDQEPEPEKGFKDWGEMSHALKKNSRDLLDAEEKRKKGKKI